MGTKYSLELDHAIVAARLHQLCPPSGKVIVMGQQLGWPAVHYSGRLGWVEQCRALSPDWQERFQKYRDLGAGIVAVYFDPTVPPRVRKTYQPMLQTLPLLEHQVGPWFRRNRPCEYYILSLGAPKNGAPNRQPAGAREPVISSTSERTVR
jgi:hypothetical protein